MIKNRKQMLVIIGVFILTLLLGTVTFAFFNYNRTGAANTIRVGRIAFVTRQTETISLTNLFPIDPTETGIMDDDEKVGTLTIEIEGDTDYSGGVEYLVSSVDSSITTSTGKIVPLSLNVTVNSDLGTSSANYFTARENTNTSIYKRLVGDTLVGDQMLLVGYIAPNSTPGTASGIDGSITIKAYLDKNKILISDTYDGTESDNMGTPNSLAQGKTVLTTSEWNTLKTSGISFKVKVEANEGVWVQPICKRATVLHTEECTQTSYYCAGDGYTGNNTTITYGNLGTAGTLVAGDAFDCDVNGDGIVNVDGNGNSTERFYYVSPYYDTNTQTFDNTTATLIYYSNTYNNGSSVVASTNGAAYDDSFNNWHGPVTAVTHLPSTSQWSNITLKTASRTILACDNADCSNTPVLTTNNGSNAIENPFNYTGRAARLLTLMELANGCKGTINNNTSLSSAGSLTACNFLFEGTQYADSSKATYGPWLETPHASRSRSVWVASPDYRSVPSSDVGNPSRGARPAIDVAMSDIQY